MLSLEKWKQGAQRVTQSDWFYIVKCSALGWLIGVGLSLICILMLSVIF